MAETTRRLLLEGGLLAAIFVAANLLAVTSQKRISHNDGLGFDGPQYALITMQIMLGQTPHTISPYVVRPAVPWITARALGPLDVDQARDAERREALARGFRRIDRGFRRIDWLANAVTFVALLALVRVHVRDLWARLVVAALFATAWIGPVRLMYYVPVHVDFTATACSTVGLLLVDTLARRRSYLLALLLVALSLAGAAVHESYIAVPIAYLALVARKPLAGEPTTASSAGLTSRFPPLWPLPLIAFATTYYLVRQYVEPIDARVNSFYGEHALRMLREKPWHFLPVAWLAVFGPVLVLPLYRARASLAFLLENCHFAVYLLMILLICISGGLETERYVFWAFPVVYLLIGRALDDLGPRLVRAPFLIGLVVVSQLLAQRVFFPIPDYPTDYPRRLPLLTPWGSHFPYSDLLSAHANPSIPMLATVQYAVLIAVMVWLLRRSEKTVAPS